jgi:outer membrane immunogenic protein
VENLLLYVTGGLAWGSFDRNWVFNCADECLQSPIVETFSHGRTRWGGVVGFGTEWDWGGGWSIRAETLYMMFQKDTQTFSSFLAEEEVRTKNFESSDDLWTSRIGISYRFGGFGKYPVAARY